MEDLDVDKETTEEGKTKLSPHGHKTKTDAETATPVFCTQLYAIILFPLETRLNIYKSLDLMFTFMCKE